MARAGADAVELTVKLLQSLKPPASGRIELADTKVRGLWYRLTAAGARSWALRYRVPGEGRAGSQRKFTIGDASEISLADARRLAEALRGEIGNGIDPAASRRASLAEARAQQTVADLAPRWLRSVEAKRAKTSYRNYESAMRLHILPQLGRLRVADVERRHVATLHDRMQSMPVGASRVLACLSVFMNWAEIEGARPPRSNPCYGIDRYPETMRQRFLTHEELIRIGRALAEAERRGLPPSPAMQAKSGGGMSKVRRAKYGKDPKRPLRGPYKRTGETLEESNTTAPARKTTPADTIAVSALRLMLFTGWRLAEVVSTRWADVDLDHRVVRHRSTKGGAVARPLSAPACELLADVAQLSAASPWVFPRATDATKHIGKPVRLWDAVRHAAGLNAADKAERVMPHDLRHSVGAVAASGGASLVVIASLLGHKQVRTTERYAHLSRDARHDTADRVGQIIAGALKQGDATRDEASISRSPTPLHRRRRA